MLHSFANIFNKLILNNDDGQAWPGKHPFLMNANIPSNIVYPWDRKEDHSIETAKKVISQIASRSTKLGHEQKEMKRFHLSSSLLLS